MTSFPRCDATAAWAALRGHFEAHGRELRPARGLRRATRRASSASASRRPRCSADLSKNLHRRGDAALPADLARECGVEARRDAMFAGEAINITEGRAVLHTALRAPPRRGAVHRDEVHATLRGDARLSPRRCARDGAAASPTSSTSASAAATSGRRWRCRRSTRSSHRGCASTSSPTSTATTSPRCCAASRPTTRCSSIASQDLHHAGDDGQRATRPRRWFVQQRRHRHRAPLRRRSPPTWTRRRASASAPPSASGTGSAAATRCGRRSACRSRIAIGADGLPRAAGRRARDGRALRTRAAREQPAGAARPARRLVPQLPRLREPLRRAVPPGR